MRPAIQSAFELNGNWIFHEFTQFKCNEVERTLICTYIPCFRVCDCIRTRCPRAPTSIESRASALILKLVWPGFVWALCWWIKKFTYEEMFFAYWISLFTNVNLISDNYWNIRIKKPCFWQICSSTRNMFWLNFLCLLAEV
jgi:hypothetical protein